MAQHNVTGKKGESLASSWIRNKGFRILDQNWRIGHLEIDLVAEKNGKLHIIEVKTTRGDRYGYPESKVTRTKLKRLLRAGSAYLGAHPQWKRVEYDILSIRLREEGAEYFFIEDVYL